MTIVLTVNFHLLGYEGKGRKFLVPLPGVLFAQQAVLSFLLLVTALFAWHQSDWELG